MNELTIIDEVKFKLDHNQDIFRRATIWPLVQFAISQRTRIAALEEQLTITQHTLGLTVLAAEAERARAERAREGLHLLLDNPNNEFRIPLIAKIYAETAPASTAPQAVEGEYDPK